MNPEDYAARLHQRVEGAARDLFRRCVTSSSVPPQSGPNLTVDLRLDAVTFRKRIEMATEVMKDSTMDPFARAEIAAEILEASVR